MDAKEAKIYLAIMIAVGVLAIILIYFIVTILRHQKRLRQLHASRIHAEITMREKERKRIAEDLHDELGPIVGGITLLLGSMDDVESNRPAMTRVQQNIETLMERMKAISDDLLPMSLIKKGLFETVKGVVADLNRSKVIRARLHPAQLPALPEMVAVNVYRIIQEIINNTIKHAEAKSLDIQMKIVEQKLSIFTSDDGKGFDQEHISGYHTGLGLRNIYTRTEYLGGSLYLDTKIGRGTNYLVEIPLHNTIENAN